MSKQSHEDAGSGNECNRCLMCGNDRFTWGKAVGHYQQKFKSDDSGWITKNTVFGGQRIRARKCDACGNIQLFVSQ
jgi:hypothetical protein